VNVLTDLIQWLTAPEQWSGPDGIPARTVQHLWYSLLAAAIAIVIALPIGIGVGHARRGGLLVVGIVLSALLAFSADLLLVGLQRGLTPWARTRGS
jgi:osmoprotectant transport system permease protein